MEDLQTINAVVDRLSRQMAEAMVRIVGTAPAPQMQKSIPQYASLVGIVPPHLRGLYLLVTELKELVRSECHRRCVEMLGSESYDNEHVEYAVFCQVSGDPAFTGEAAVADVFSQELEAIFPELTGSRKEVYDIFINKDWNIYCVGKSPNYRITNSRHPLLCI